MHIGTRCVVASAHAAEVSGCVAKCSDTPSDGRKGAPHTDEITTEHRTRPAATPHHHALDAHNCTCHHNGVAGAGGRLVVEVVVVVVVVVAVVVVLVVVLVLVLVIVVVVVVLVIVVVVVLRIFLMAIIIVVGGNSRWHRW